MSNVLEGLDGVICHMDDILVYGGDQSMHDQRLVNVLHRLAAAGIKLNGDKCDFSQECVKFLGHVVDGDGIRADPEKITAVRSMPEPSNITQVRGFSGMANHLAKFMPDLAEITAPLRDLLRKDAGWHCGDEQQQAFNLIKKRLISPPTLTHYDPNAKIVLSADASSYGLGAALKQEVNHCLHPVAYASRSLTATEQRCAQIEKEALALTWACEKFRNYLIGLTFNLETDHKPLLSLFAKKNLDELSPRIQRFRMRFAWYDYNVKFVSGKNLIVPDFLSRLPLSHFSERDEQLLKEVETYIDAVTAVVPATDRRLREIREGLLSDATCSKVIDYCTKGWPRIISADLVPFERVAADLSYARGLLLKRETGWLFRKCYATT